MKNRRWIGLVSSLVVVVASMGMPRQGHAEMAYDGVLCNSLYGVDAFSYGGMYVQLYCCDLDTTNGCPYYTDLSDLCNSLIPQNGNFNNTQEGYGDNESECNDYNGQCCYVSYQPV